VADSARYGMPERQFELFDQSTAALMRAAYHDVCTELKDCTEEERERVVNCIIQLVQDGERRRSYLSSKALALLRPS